MTSFLEVVDLEVAYGPVEAVRGVSLAVANTYWIVSPKSIARTPKIATFRQWLLAEAEEDARRLDPIYPR